MNNAKLIGNRSQAKITKENPTSGIRYCCTCYDHLAGYVAANITESLEEKGCLIKTENAYTVTEKG